MPASKIVDEQEVLQWFEDGLTYEEMSRIYREKYNIETVPSLWGNFRRRRGLVRRIVRDEELIPWAVKEEHRWAYPLQMLRLEARARAGQAVREADAVRHANFIDMLRRCDSVVAYDPDTPEGFHIVPRRPDDTDIVRRPPLAQRTTRHAVDPLPATRR